MTGSEGGSDAPPTPHRPPAERRTVESVARRGADILVALAVAPIVGLIVGFLGVAVKLDSSGPMFVTHERVGRGGRLFPLYKLRTMVEDADRLKAQLGHLNVLPWPDFKIPNDPRITRIGRVLRRTSLDELPQFWNLLRGDLTLVGPRPCSIEVARYELWQTERLERTPGLFGRWQAEGRGTTSFDDRCRMDIEQVRERSLASDAKLAARTLKSLFTGRGAQ